MTDVRNWQIGRTMAVPMAVRRPRRQFAFVFNTNRCVGCQTCTLACRSTWTHGPGQEANWWCNVESKPFGGYPRGWDARLLGMLEEASMGQGLVWEKGVYKGPTIFEAGSRNDLVSQVALGYLPPEEDWRTPNPGEDASTGYTGGTHGISVSGSVLPEHQSWFFYLMRMCNHCSFPACEAACPTRAISKREEDGLVLVDPERCRGHRKCVEACPYKKAMYRPTTGKAEKCHGCLPRLEGADPLSKGQPSAAHCVSSCIGRTLLQGLVKVGKDGDWEEDRWNPVYYLVKVAKVALPLYPQFGTEPHGYYIPPRWVRREYLRQMFGPGVDAAIEKISRPDRDLLAALQLFGVGSRLIHRYEAKADAVVAYGHDDKELFRTVMEDPIHVRKDDRPGTF